MHTPTLFAALLIVVLSGATIGSPLEASPSVPGADELARGHCTENCG